MTELSGTLEGMDMLAIVRFLAGLQKTGALRVTHQDWRGVVFFEAGRVTSAQLGSHQGMSALDALVLALPGGSFVFDVDASPPAKANVELSHEALLAHLEELAARTGTGGCVLPSLESVPQLIAQTEDARHGNTVPLDRATLPTLLLIDGQRTVGEIMGLRGSSEALWQVAHLAEVGLVGLSTPHGASDASAAPAVPAAPTFPGAPTPHTAPARLQAALAPLGPPAATSNVTACPRLGFEDDPASSFARPTRLHRCFAAATPLPLSLDQQRELCLTEQFGTCPRLGAAGLTPSTADNATVASAPAADQRTSVDQPADDPRIVRLPVGARARPNPHVNGPVEAAPAASQPAPPPTPLRARSARGSSGAATAVVEPVPANPSSEPRPKSTPPSPSQRPSGVTASLEVTPPRRGGFLNVPSTTAAGAAVVLMVIAVVAALLLPRLNDVFVDEQGVDLSSLPNASAAIAGTPVSDLPAAKSADPDAAANADSAAQSEPTAAAVNTSTAAPGVEPTAQPEPTAAPAPASTRTLLDESFDDNSRKWPNNPQGIAWVSGGTLRLEPRRASQFVALGVPPVGEILQDVTISGTFRKIGGPPGCGYGFIVRDQGPGPRDGVNQAGRYYVLEVGDNGEVGIWRREGDRWVDLLPWQRAEAVHPGNVTNDVTVRASGDRLSLSVNGTEVAVRNDANLTVGNVGIFVGGDGNQVALEQLTVTTP
jgi:hypothetical protein